MKHLPSLTTTVCLSALLITLAPVTAPAADLQTAIAGAIAGSMPVRSLTTGRTTMAEPASMDDRQTALGRIITGDHTGTVVTSPQTAAVQSAGPRDVQVALAETITSNR